MITWTRAARVLFATALAAAGVVTLFAGAWAHDSGFGLARFTADGTLDRTFGTDGLVVTRSSGRSFVANALALQPDARILIAGMISDLASASLQVAVERHNPDGALDAIFGSAGMATAHIGTAGAEARAVALQPDGKIIVAGTAFGSGAAGTEDRFAVARFNTDGSLDLTFGAGGTVTTRVGTGGAGAVAMALQADGKIVVAGTAFANGATDDDFAVVRYQTDGSLDDQFGTGGIVTTDIGSGQSAADPSVDRASAVSLQPDGKIVIGGRTSRGEQTAFAVVRYGADGNLDPGFGAAGKATAAANSDAQAHALVIQPDGALVLAGSAGSKSDTQASSAPFALLRWRPDGRPDPSFGSSGLVTTLFEGSRSGARALAAQPDGKLLAGGAKYGAPAASGDALPISGFALTRYTPDGRLDDGFGTSGTTLIDVGDAGATPVSLAIQPDGKIVVAGLAFFRSPQPTALSPLDDRPRLALVAIAAGLTLLAGALFVRRQRRRSRLSGSAN